MSRKTSVFLSFGLIFLLLLPFLLPSNDDLDLVYLEIEGESIFVTTTPGTPQPPPPPIPPPPVHLILVFLAAVLVIVLMYLCLKAIEIRNYMR